MELTRKNSFPIKINRKLIFLLLNLPGLWLTVHIFIRSLQKNPSFTSRDLWNLETKKPLVQEFQFYRNNIYLFFTVILIIVGIYILIDGLKRILGRGEISNNVRIISYLIPGTIQGILFVTFSYALAGVLLDLYQALMKFI